MRKLIKQIGVFSLLLIICYPTGSMAQNCGGVNQDACDAFTQVYYGIGPCQSGLVHYFGGRNIILGECYKPDANGYPGWCGDDNESACLITSQIAFGVSACKSGLTDYLGTCYSWDSEGFPNFCGHNGQDACSPLAIVHFGLPAVGLGCRSDLTNY